MADYNKLTVVKLKEELKSRGLPQTGLKAVLVARLIEADAQPELGTTTLEDGDDTKQEDPTEELVQNSDVQGDDTAARDTPSTKEEGLDNVKDDPESPNAKEPAPERPNGEAVSKETVSLEKEELRERLDADAKALNEAQSKEIEKTSPVINEESTVATIDLSGLDSQPEDKDFAVEQEKSELSATVIEPSIISAQTSFNKEEVLEDTRKRKRRSQSPPPSSIEGAIKKAKALDGSPLVRLPEDVIDQKVDNGPTTEAQTEVLISGNGDNAMNLTDEGRQSAPEVQEASTLEDSDDPNRQIQQDNGTNDDATAKVAKDAPTLLDAEAVLSPAKTSPTDTRFKNLFSATPKQSGTPPKQDTYPDVEDRSVPPAMHPATPALYIRNFMRPLNSNSLKDHLATVARAGHSSPTEETIRDFFVDTIRTHCLVRFSNVSAASRVRSALHDRVWPDERIRKPLWVDFVPEEKISKWIEVEQGPANSRGQPVKRWEVVYEQEGESMTAYLQEADQAGGALRGGVNATTKDESGRGVQGAPVGPRGSDSRQQPRMAPKSDGGKGFKALDDLFQSTVAKPKLYFLPVAKPIAERRMDRLAAGRGGGRSDEMRKYTFDEEILVDRGPEFGYGRGGHRGCGAGFATGNPDRGGGYRGDSWRGRR